MNDLFNNYADENIPKKICILRLSALGDVCNALYVVQKIHQQYPQCEITWIVAKNEAKLLQVFDYIKLIEFDKSLGIAEIRRVWRLLSGQNFDALLHMQTAFRASILSLGIKAKYKIGYNKERSRELQWLFCDQKITKPNQNHTLDGFIAFAQKIGVVFNRNEPCVWDYPKVDIKFLQRNKTQKLAVISPCASKKVRDIPLEYMLEIIDFLHKKNINVVLTSSPSTRETQYLSEICAKSNAKNVINMGGKTNLQGLVSLISAADLVICPDSAAAHIASLENIPTVGLYCRQNPTRTGPYNFIELVASSYEDAILQQYNKPLENLPWATTAKGDDLMYKIDLAQVKLNIERALALKDKN